MRGPIGAIAAMLSGKGSPAEQSARAARCALGLQELLPDSPIVVVTGWGVLAETTPVGRLIDLAAQELEKAPCPGVWLDQTTASILGDRFQLCQAGKELLGSNVLSDNYSKEGDLWQNKELEAVQAARKNEKTFRMVVLIFMRLSITLLLVLLTPREM